MPDPLPSDIVARLRSDSTAALAASLILAGSFPDIVSWALRAFSVKDSEPKVAFPRLPPVRRADLGGQQRVEGTHSEIASERSVMVRFIRTQAYRERLLRVQFAIAI